MESVKLCLMVTTCYALLYQAVCMPQGPPQSACLLLMPAHGNNLPLTGPAIAQLDGLAQDANYIPGTTLEFSLLSTGMFRGFMIQARTSLLGDAIGMFELQSDNKQQLMECTSEADTLAHMNANDVSSVSIRWRANSLSDDTTSFSFYYTVVQNVSTYWVRLSSSEISVTHPVAPGDVNYPLVKAHGAIMLLSWGLFAPVGILLAFFYKVVWPNGEWFYSHIALMVAALVGTLVGVIVIVIHAKGLWLNTTDANLAHQILGIMVVITVCLNPFMAIVRCDPSSQWRFLFNWAHGTTGLILGQGLAFAAMMLGLNAFKDLPGVYRDRIHIAIYIMSAIIGLIIMILAMYNFYAIMFQKYFPTEPDELATQSEAPSGMIPDKPLYSTDYADDNDELETSRDYLTRSVVGIGIIVFLVLLVLTAIILIGLA